VTPPSTHHDRPREAAAPTAEALPPFRKRAIIISVMLITVMQILDTSITNVALPHMQGSLSAWVDEVSWVITSYLAANAIAIPATAGRMQLVATIEDPAIIQRILAHLGLPSTREDPRPLWPSPQQEEAWPRGGPCALHLGHAPMSG